MFTLLFLIAIEGIFSSLIVSKDKHCFGGAVLQQPSCFFNLRWYRKQSINHDKKCLMDMSVNAFMQSRTLFCPASDKTSSTWAKDGNQLFHYLEADKC